MSSTPNTGMDYVIAGQNTPEATHNAALDRADALMHLTIQDRDLTSPPGSPTNGHVYLVGTSATGAWSGQDGKLAFYYDGWTFLSLIEGMVAWIADEDLLLVWKGAAWHTVTSGSGGTDATTVQGVTPGATGLVVLATATAAAGRAAVGAGPAGMYKSGHYIATYYGSQSTFSNSLGALYVGMFEVPRSCTIDELVCECTATAVDALFRMGVYASNSDGIPGTLLLDAGTVDTSSSTGVKTISLGTPLALTPGRYWLAGVNQGSNSATMRINSGANPSALLFHSTVMSLSYSGYVQTGVTGALPDPWGSTLTATTNHHRILAKLV